MRLAHLGQFIVTLIVAACVTRSARAQLRVENPIVDLGIVRGGQHVAARFDLVNAGAMPLEILTVERGCGCLAPRLDQRQLAPGAKTTLSLELRTLGQADGPHTWSLQVQYRAGAETKTLPLSLRGTVKSDITVQPAILGLHVTKSIEQEITLTDARPTPLRVVHAELRTPGLQVTKITRDGKTTKILVTADAAKLPPGRHEGLLTLTTDDSEYEQLRIPIVVTKSSAATVSAVPEQAVVLVAQGATTASTLVRLRSGTDQPVRIAKIEPSDPAFTCTWAPGPGNDATLKIRVSATRATGMLPGQVAVHLASPELEVITIPVIVRHD